MPFREMTLATYINFTTAFHTAPLNAPFTKTFQLNKLRNKQSPASETFYLSFTSLTPQQSPPRPRSFKSSEFPNRYNYLLADLPMIRRYSRRHRALSITSNCDFRANGNGLARTARSDEPSRDERSAGVTRGSKGGRGTWRKSAVCRAELNNARVKAPYTRGRISLTPGESSRLAPENISPSRGEFCHPRRWINAARSIRARYSAL